MLTSRFGIEVELTGITRKQAAKTAAAFLGGRVESSGDYYDTKGYCTGWTDMEIHERREHPDSEKGKRQDCGGWPGI